MRLRCRLRSSVSLLAQTKYRVAYVELVSKIMRSDYFKCGNFVYHFCLETGSHRFVQNFSANAQDKFGEFSLRKCLAGFAEGRNLIAQDSIGDRPHRFGRRISHALKKLPRDRRLFSGVPGKPYAVRRPKTNDYSFTSIALDGLDDLLGESLWSVIISALETVTNRLVYVRCRSQKAQTVMIREPLLNLAQ